jgi:hypothetical protein
MPKTTFTVCHSCAMPFDPGPDTREIRSAAGGVLHLIGLVCGCLPAGRTRAGWEAYITTPDGEGLSLPDDE